MKGKNKEFAVTVTEADHQQMVAEGADPQYALKPGHYKARRGGFRERHQDVDASTAEAKVRITIYLDSKVIEHFKRLADTPGSAGYQTLINDALRRIVEAGDLAADFAGLINNDAFIDAIAKRLAEKR